MVAQTYVLFLCFLFGTIHHVQSLKKRLLDNDVDARIRQLEITVQTLVGEVASLKQSNVATQSHKGAVYVRWGRKDCPMNGTELLYTGMVGGGWYLDKGAPSDYICLPHDPDFNSGDTTSVNDINWESTLYGAEYEDNYFGNQLLDNDVPCAVCRATQRSSIVMVPGKKRCFQNWKVEYYGRLAAGPNIEEASSQYICVDNNPQSLEAGNENKNGKLVYPVRAKCGTLRCPPYHDRAFITCVVCSN